MTRMLALAAAGLFIAGCGGGGSKPKGDRAQVQQVAKEFSDAFADGDGASACDLMTTEGKAELQKAAVFIGAVGCENAVKAAAKQLDAADREKVKHRTIDTMEVTGDFAIVRPSFGDPIKLRKKSGQWLVDIPAENDAP